MIIRAAKQSQFTIIGNTAANDNNLSLKAKGLFYFLMTKPDNWSITREGLCKQLPEGKTSIDAALKELEDNFYLIRWKTRDSEGRFKFNATLYENPAPDAVQTVSENRTLDKPPQVNTNIVNTNDVTGVTLSTTPKTDKSNPEINQLLETFEFCFGYKLKHPTGNRRAAWNLIRRYGASVALEGIRAAAAARDQTFAPQIVSLEDLWFKWDKLESFYRRNEKKHSMKIAPMPEEL